MPISTSANGTSSAKPQSSTKSFFDVQTSSSAPTRPNNDDEFEVDADGIRRRINSFFSKEQEEEFEKIFIREQQLGTKFSRKELREVARSMSIPAGGEQRLFRWFENRRAWIKARNSKRGVPNADPVSENRTVKRRRSPMGFKPPTVVDLSTPPLPSSYTISQAANTTSLSFQNVATGTHIITPASASAACQDLTAIPFSALITVGMLIDLGDYLSLKADLSNLPSIDYDAFPEDLDLSGKALLLHCGVHAASSPFLTEAAAQVLTQKGVSIVAIDWASLDRVPSSPSKHTLLQNNIPVIEKLCHVGSLLAKLSELPTHQQSFIFHAVPLALPGLGIAPLRAYAVIPP